MGAKRTKTRKLLWTVAVLVLLFIAVVALLPVWFPWVARPAARQLGVEWGEYQAEGYSRGVLRDVHGEFGQTTVTAEEARVHLPNRWAWQDVFGADPADSHARISGWRVEVAPRAREGSSGDGKTNSTAAVLNQLERAFVPLRRWLPRAELVDGTVAVSGRELVVPEAVWSNGVIWLTAVEEELGQRVEIRADLSTTNDYALEAEVSPLDVDLDLRVRQTNRVWSISGTANWRSNEIQVEAQFEEAGMLPERAKVRAADLRVGEDVLALPGYVGASGSVRLDWETNTFWADIEAALTPAEAGAPTRPPLRVDLEGQGSPTNVTITRLNVRAPWIETWLAAPLAVRWNGGMEADPTELQVAADLGASPLTNVSGQVRGKVAVEPRGTNWPTARFEFTGGEVSAGGISNATVTTAGRVQWPRLTVEALALQIGTNAVMRTAAEVDLEERSIQGAPWELSGEALRPYLPTNIGFESLQATGSISGSLTQPHHSGTAVITGLAVPGVRTGDARVQWSGKLLDLTNAAVTWTAGPVQVRAAGAMGLEATNGTRAHASLDVLEWTRGGEPVYRLKSPLLVGARQTAAGWRVEVDSFDWESPTGGIQVTGVVQWPAEGNLTVAVRDLGTADFLDLFDLAEVEGRVPSLDATAQWDGGPVKFSVDAIAEVSVPEAGLVEVNARVAGDGNGVEIRQLVLGTEVLPRVYVQGHLPVVLRPAEDPLVQFSQEMPLSLQASNAPVAEFTQAAEAIGRVTLVRPQVRLDLGGHLADLQGGLHLQLARLDWVPPTNAPAADAPPAAPSPLPARPGDARAAEGGAGAVPALRDVEVRVRVEQDRIELSELSLVVQGQPIRATGVWPVKPTFLEDLIERGTWPDWQRAHARLSMTNADLATLGALVAPDLIVQGRATAEIQLEPGAQLDGQIVLTNVTTAPLPTLGPIREVSGTIRLENREVRVDEVVGYVAAAPFQITGTANLENPVMPELRFTLRGTNLPLVRQPGVILRSDVDLQFSAVSNEPPVISGDVILRRSLFMKSLQGLVQPPGARAERQFPFFSVKTEPLRQWKLNVRVAGNEFLRVRTPVFVGVVSANFQVEGTLGDPLALGEVRIASGRITFPFGRLTVNSGSVMVGSDAPHRPRLSVNAGGRAYGYEIKMAVSGYADEPEILLSSTPPLNSGQILLLLTAGELPQDPGYFSTEQRAQTLAVFLGKDLLSRITGSEFGEERLVITSGERVSEGGRSTYEIEYKLTENWSLVGEYDRFDSLNLYVKWRFYSR